MKCRKERKAEEQRIIEELERDLPSAPKKAEQKRSYGKDMPEKLHCKRCKTELQNGVCPVCGYRVYMPMDEKKQKKIRLIVGGVCVAVFLIVFLLTR